MKGNSGLFRAIDFALLMAVLALGAACAGGASGPADLTPGPPSVDLHVVAKGLKFDAKTLSAVANSDASLTLENRDATPHNLSVYTDKSAKQAIFKGNLVSSRQTETYRFKTPAPGTYYFRCDVHPDMNGALVVQ